MVLNNAWDNILADDYVNSYPAAHKYNEFNLTKLYTGTKKNMENVVCSGTR